MLEEHQTYAVQKNYFGQYQFHFWTSSMEIYTVSMRLPVMVQDGGQNSENR